MIFSSLSLLLLVIMEMISFSYSYVSFLNRYQYGIKKFSNIIITKLLVSEFNPEDKNKHRKKKVNKYSQFSKTGEEDLLDIAVREADERIKANQLKKDNLEKPMRGTTIPTLEASPKLNNNITNFNEYKKVIPSDASTFGYINIGKILGTHGIKGELKIKFETDFPHIHFSSDKYIFLKRPNRRAPRPIQVITGRKQNNEIYLVKLKGILARESAQSLKGCLIYIKGNINKPDLSQDEYLIRDLIDAPCYIENNNLPIGKIIGIVPPDELCSPAAAKLMHAMIEIKLLENNELCLIPLVPSIVYNVKYLDNGQIHVHIRPPKGLLEQTYKEFKRIRIKGYLPDKCIGYN